MGFFTRYNSLRTGFWGHLTSQTRRSFDSYGSYTLSPHWHWTLLNPSQIVYFFRVGNRAVEVSQVNPW